MEETKNTPKGYTWSLSGTFRALGMGLNLLNMVEGGALGLRYTWPLSENMWKIWRFWKLGMNIWELDMDGEGKFGLNP